MVNIFISEIRRL